MSWGPPRCTGSDVQASFCRPVFPFARHLYCPGIAFSWKRGKLFRRASVGVWSTPRSISSSTNSTAVSSCSLVIGEFLIRHGGGVVHEVHGRSIPELLPMLSGPVPPYNDKGPVEKGGIWSEVRGRPRPYVRRSDRGVIRRGVRGWNRSRTRSLGVCTPGGLEVAHKVAKGAPLVRPHVCHKVRSDFRSRSPTPGQPLDLRPFLRIQPSHPIWEKNSELWVQESRTTGVHNWVVPDFPDVVRTLWHLRVSPVPSSGGPQMTGNPHRLEAVLEPPGEEFWIPNEL
jgi:hypothetical protein